MKHTCLIYNYAQHYRLNIFSLMNSMINCDFFFGDKMEDVKKIDYSLLSNFVKEVENKKFLYKPLYFQKGVIPLINKSYTNYIILGDLHCISTWILLVLGKIYRKKIYLWTHGWYGKEIKVKKIIKKLFFGLSEGVFLYGNYARNLMIKEGINMNKLHVIYNSLSYDIQLSIRIKINKNKIYEDHFNNKLKNLIFIGRLTPIKNLELLLEALAKLNSQCDRFNLTIIGEGVMENDLKALSIKLKLEDRIWFYGATYDEFEIAKLIYNADLCISPGNVGLTAIHSMTYGTPVITHNNYAYQMPEFEAIEDGTTGTFFDHNECNSLVDSINRWFSKSPNRNYIREKCYEIIDTKYNPHLQIKTIKNALGITI